MEVTHLAMEMGLMPNPACGAFCACGKVAATLAGDHAAARALAARSKPFTTFLLPPGQTAATCKPCPPASGGPGAEGPERLNKIYAHLLRQHGAQASLLPVERPLMQAAAASAHDCTVLMQALIGLPSVNPDQVRHPTLNRPTQPLVLAQRLA